MIEMQPAGITNSDVVLSRDGERLGEIDRAWWRESGTVEIAGETLEVERSLLGRRFTMTRQGLDVARAERSGMLTQRWTVTAGSRRLTVATAHLFTQRLKLTEDGSQIGTISRHLLSARRGRADLPDDLDLAEQVFICFVALLVWDRKRSSGAGGAGGGAN